MPDEMIAARTARSRDSDVIHMAETGFAGNGIADFWR
jgi:hypothetical protein